MHKAPLAACGICTLAAGLLLLSGCLPSGKKSEAPAELKTEVDKISYSIGTQIGQNLKQSEVIINSDLLARGVDDVINDRKLALSEQEMTTVMQKFQTDMMAKRQQAQAKQQTENRAKASAYLAENAAKPGVTTLPDSLQYTVVKEGTGAIPKPTDTVRVHYTGYFVDGTEFDSSYKRNQPAEFTVNGVIPGWSKVLSLMKVGSKWKIVIPPALAYGEMGNPPTIPPNSLLIFDIELLEIVKKK